MKKTCDCECHGRGLAEKYSGELRGKIELAEAMPCVYCVARHPAEEPETPASSADAPKGFPF
jgi:hypothetical protein